MSGVAVENVGGVGALVIATTYELYNVTVSDKRRHLHNPLKGGGGGGGKREREKYFNLTNQCS